MELQLNQLSYHIDDRKLINNINLRSATSHCTALLGENGAGKTLLLYLCHGLLKPSFGTVLWNTCPPNAWRGAITMVFQKPLLLRRSAYKNIDHALFLQGLSKPKRAKRIMASLEQVGMTEYRECQAHVLSGGQQQRLAIARAWALQPSVILMDEPTSDLDMHSAVAVEDIIKDMHGSGIKIIIATHNLAQVKRLCDEVIFMNRGKLLCHTSKNDFFNKVSKEPICTFIKSQEF